MAVLSHRHAASTEISTDKGSAQ